MAYTVGVAPPTKLTPTKQAAYLVALESTGVLSSSAALVKVSRQCIYDRMKVDHEFRTACEEAQGRLDARLMASVRMLAIEGTVTERFGKKGEVVSRTTVVDTRMLIAWLKMRDRAAWGDKLDVDKTTTTHHIEERRIRVEDMTGAQLMAARAFVATLPEGPDAGEAGDVV